MTFSVKICNNKTILLRVLYNIGQMTGFGKSQYPIMEAEQILCDSILQLAERGEPAPKVTSVHSGQRTERQQRNEKYSNDNKVRFEAIKITKDQSIYLREILYCGETGVVPMK